MKNEKVFAKLLFVSLMFSFGFVFWGNVQNAKANPNDCADAGGVCSSTNNCINVAGSTGVQIPTVWCDWGTTQTSACCVATPVLVCCQISADTCAENTSGLCPGSIVPIPGSCSNVSTCPQYTSPDVSDPVDDGSGSTSPDVSDPVSDPVAGCAAGSICFASPLAFTTVEGVLGSILSTLQGIIVLISIVFIVIGAVMYITSAGNEKQIGMAKSAITASMIGLAIGIAAPSFLREIATILGWGTTGNAEVDSAQTLAQIATRVLDFLLAIIGVLGIIMLVIGGATYLTSAGSDKKIDTAKAITKWAIVGIVVALAAMVLVKQIARFFV